MNKYQIFGTLSAGIGIGIFYMALINGRVFPQPTPQIAATSTQIVGLTLTPLARQSIIYNYNSSYTCFYAEKTGCVVSIADLNVFKTYLPILKALKSGQFAVTANHIVIPMDNGSSTDLMTVLNLMQKEINK